MYGHMRKLTVQDTQGVQIVHASCNVQQTPVDGHLQNHASSVSFIRHQTMFPLHAADAAGRRAPLPLCVVANTTRKYAVFTHHLWCSRGLVMEPAARHSPVQIALVTELRQQPCLLHTLNSSQPAVYEMPDAIALFKGCLP